MIEGKTTSGFEYSIEEYKLDNWELLEVLTSSGTVLTRLSPCSLICSMTNR